MTRGGWKLPSSLAERRESVNPWPLGKLKSRLNRREIITGSGCRGFGETNEILVLGLRALIPAEKPGRKQTCTDYDLNLTLACN